MLNIKKHIHINEIILNLKILKSIVTNHLKKIEIAITKTK